MQQTAAKPPAAAEGNTPVQATVTFQFDRNGLPVPRYTLVIHEDGSGTYHAGGGGAALGGLCAATGNSQAGGSTDDAVAETTAKIFQTARSLNLFNMFCGTKVKNIADTGKKILSYTGSEGAGTCTYNYSDDKNVTMLTDLFYGIAYTMDVGRRLDFERRFDRLGLDAELISLEKAVESKDAIELGNIAQTLRTIAGDGDVMQRVRVRAGKLLDQSGSGK